MLAHSERQDVSCLSFLYARITGVLERALYRILARLAKRNNVSLPMKVCDLVEDAHEVQEDRALTAVAEHRKRTFSKKAALLHEQMW